MKFFLDVMLSKNKKFLKDHPNLLNVKDEINGTVNDKTIIRHAKKRKYGIYTQDKRFALEALIAGVVVCYRDQKTGRKHKLKIQEMTFSKSEAKV